jgi:hypothetical protein
VVPETPVCGCAPVPAARTPIQLSAGTIIAEAAQHRMGCLQSPATAHVTGGRPIVAHQRERIEWLARSGQDTTEAERTLNLFTRTLEERRPWPRIVSCAERGCQHASWVMLAQGLLLQ